MRALTSHLRKSYRKSLKTFKDPRDFSELETFFVIYIQGFEFAFKWTEFEGLELLGILPSEFFNESVIFNIPFDTNTMSGNRRLLDAAVIIVIECYFNSVDAKISIQLLQCLLSRLVRSLVTSFFNVYFGKENLTRVPSFIQYLEGY